MGDFEDLREDCERFEWTYCLTSDPEVKRGKHPNSRKASRRFMERNRSERHLRTVIHTLESKRTHPISLRKFSWEVDDS